MNPTSTVALVPKQTHLAKGHHIDNLVTLHSTVSIAHLYPWGGNPVVVKVVWQFMITNLSSPGGPVRDETGIEAERRTDVHQ